MTLQRRLLLYLLICAPIVWSVALLASAYRARSQINEMFDTELVRLAQQVEATLINASLVPSSKVSAIPSSGHSDMGDADVRDLAVAIWDINGKTVLADREGLELPFASDAEGFKDVDVQGRTWRVFYLTSNDSQWRVAAGQGAFERDELLYGLMLTQAVPWLLVLPVLLIAMTWAVRRALAPMRLLTEELSTREAKDLKSIPDSSAPGELRPLISAMNGLFLRIDQLLQRERRFTADSAHEMRTPLAVLRAQWDVVQHAGDPTERQEAESKLGLGLERMERLVTQMLALARAESGIAPDLNTEIDWQSIVEHAVSDCLLLLEQRRIDLACEWPAAGQHPFPLLGNPNLITVLLRNLIDNAVRYSPVGGTVQLRFGQEYLVVENDGDPLKEEQLSRLGERFYRPDGQRDGGSGLGVSIIRRIAQLHGLSVSFGSKANGEGVRVTIFFSDEPQ